MRQVMCWYGDHCHNYQCTFKHINRMKCRYGEHCHSPHCTCDHGPNGRKYDKTRSFIDYRVSQLIDSDDDDDSDIECYGKKTKFSPIKPSVSKEPVIGVLNVEEEETVSDDENSTTCQMIDLGIAGYYSQEDGDNSDDEDEDDDFYSDDGYGDDDSDDENTMKRKQHRRHHYEMSNDDEEQPIYSVSEEHRTIQLIQSWKEQLFILVRENLKYRKTWIEVKKNALNSNEKTTVTVDNIESPMKTFLLMEDCKKNVGLLILFEDNSVMKFRWNNSQQTRMWKIVHPKAMSLYTIHKCSDPKTFEKLFGLDNLYEDVLLICCKLKSEIDNRNISRIQVINAATGVLIKSLVVTGLDNENFPTRIINVKDGFFTVHCNSFCNVIATLELREDSLAVVDVFNLLDGTRVFHREPSIHDQVILFSKGKRIGALVGNTFMPILYKKSDEKIISATVHASSRQILVAGRESIYKIKTNVSQTVEARPLRGKCCRLIEELGGTLPTLFFQQSIPSFKYVHLEYDSDDGMRYDLKNVLRKIPSAVSFFAAVKWPHSSLLSIANNDLKVKFNPYSIDGDTDCHECVISSSKYFKVVVPYFEECRNFKVKFGKYEMNLSQFLRQVSVKKDERPFDSFDYDVSQSYDDYEIEDEEDDYEEEDDPTLRIH